MFLKKEPIKVKCLSPVPLRFTTWIGHFHGLLGKLGTLILKLVEVDTLECTDFMDVLSHMPSVVFICGTLLLCFSAAAFPSFTFLFLFGEFLLHTPCPSLSSPLHNSFL